MYLHLGRNKGHYTKDDVREKCYTCDNVFTDFGHLMKHRKLSHPLSVNPCRHFSEGNCRHGDNCWYIHASVNPTSQTLLNDAPKEVFREVSNQSPSDPTMKEVLLMLKDMMTTYMEVKHKETEKTRSIGI